VERREGSAQINLEVSKKSVLSLSIQINMAPRRKKTNHPSGTTSRLRKHSGTGKVRSIGAAPRIFRQTPLQNLVKRSVEAFKFLQTEDPYRNGPWEARLGHIRELRHEIEERRKTGDASFDSYMIAKVRDSKTMDEVHQLYEEWNNGKTHYTTAGPLKLRFLKRLVPYDRVLPVSCNDQAKLPSTYTSLIPRPERATGLPFANFLSLQDGAEQDALFSRPETNYILRSYVSFYQHAEYWGRHNLPPKDKWSKSFKEANDLEGSNLAQFENSAFEACMGKTWADFGRLDQEIGRQPFGSGPLGFALRRGIRRAALQKAFSLITSSENREANTPWRRVAFPAPAKKFQHSHFRPWTLPRRERQDKDGRWQIDRHVEHEPSPWVYWYNQWRQQANYLSAWTRRSYGKRYWTDFKKIALPVNYLGPYISDSHCVYDDYWLKMGQSLVTLQATLEKLAVTHSRWLLERVVEDIRRGVDGEEPPDGVIPRGDIDLVYGQPNRFQLVDEMDVAWLKFLCQPPTTKALAGLSDSKPEDSLTILLDHRLQTLFNDPMHNPFWLTDVIPGETKARYRPRELPLELLLPMINMGSLNLARRDWDTGAVTWYHTPAKFHHTGAPIPNSMYQFSLKEAKLHCTRLAEMGRIV
jgi:hypothetical protein